MGLLILDEMVRMKIEPNTVSCNSVISACEKGAQWQHALWIFGEMVRMEIAPDVASCNAVIIACDNCAEWQHALWILGEMGSMSIEADEMSHSFAISASLKHRPRRQSGRSPPPTGAVYSDGVPDWVEPLD